MNSHAPPLFQNSDDSLAPIPWEISAMEWRKVIGSPFCDLTPTQKHILTVMCRFGKKFGEDIFPSQRAIELRSGVSLRCVNNALQVAEKRGWIIRHMSSNGGRYPHTSYELALPVGVADATALMKWNFWDPPYKYQIVRDKKRRFSRCDGRHILIKIDDACLP